MPDVDESKPLTRAEARARLSLRSLSLKNIGPFDQAEIELLPDGEDATTVPVAIITGENGSGKSIVIDAIRGLFGPSYAVVERPLWRPEVPFRATLRMMRDGEESLRTATRRTQDGGLRPGMFTEAFARLPARVEDGRGTAPGWVVDFWRSNLATDPYAISALEMHPYRTFLSKALQGAHKNAEVTRLLVNFDYLRARRDAREKRAGEVLYETARRIVQMSLLDGELLDVARATLTPMVRQGAQTVPLANLSSGNAYMIQRMVGLLGRMFSVNTLRREDPIAVISLPRHEMSFVSHRRPLNFVSRRSSPVAASRFGRNSADDDRRAVVLG